MLFVRVVTMGGDIGEQRGFEPPHFSIRGGRALRPLYRHSLIIGAQQVSLPRIATCLVNYLHYHAKQFLLIMSNQAQALPFFVPFYFQEQRIIEEGGT